MKKIFTLLLLIGIVQSGFTQFITKPLNYPVNGYYYLDYWMSVVDANHLWVGTIKQAPASGYQAYSMAISTSDGGDTWKFDSIPVPGSPLIQFVAAWSADVCYFVFSDNVVYGGSVWKTTDGGTTWSRKTTNQFTEGFANSMYLFSADSAIVLGDPSQGYFDIQLTYDGGNTWSRVSQANMPATLSGEWSMPNVSCRVGNSIWFCTSKGRLFRSANRGVNWTVTVPKPSTACWSVCFSDQQNGTYFLGNLIMVTTNGGDSWIQKPFISNCLVLNMSAIAGLTGSYVVSAVDSSDLSKVVVYYTHDNFNNLEKIGTGISNSSGFIYFKDAQTGWLSGNVNPQNNIHKFSGSLTGLPADSRNNNALSILPNPSNAKALLVFPAELKDIDKRIRISGLSGKIVRETIISHGVSSVELTASDLADGVYFIELLSGDRMVSSARWVVCHY